MKIIKKRSDIIEIKTDKGLKIISTKTIVVIKANRKRTVLQVNGSELINSSYSLKWFSQILTPPDFFRCHNSYLVNCRQVDCFSSKGITLKGNIIVPLSRYKLSDLEEILIKLQKEL
jgi:two-component system LytT family response regulator